MKKQFKVLLLIAMICVLAFATMLVSSAALDQTQGDNAWQVKTGEESKGYAATLAAAIADAAAGDTIYLLKDIEDGTVTIDKNLTINGQGNQLKITTATNGAYIMCNAAEVLVTNIKLIGNGTASHAYFRSSYPNSVIELNDIYMRDVGDAYWTLAAGDGTHVKFTGAKTDIYTVDPVYVASQGTKATLTIDLTTEGEQGVGKMKAAPAAKYVIRQYAGAAEINILGGIVEHERGGHWYVIYFAGGANSTLNIGGNAVINALAQTVAVTVNGDVDVNLYGNATINCSGTNNTAYGAIHVDNASATTNVAISGNATINTTVCFPAVRHDGTGDVTVSGNATLNVKSAGSYPAIFLTGNGNVTLSDSVTINVDGSNAVENKTGNVTVSGDVKIVSITSEAVAWATLHAYGNITLSDNVTIQSQGRPALGLGGADKTATVSGNVKIEVSGFDEPGAVSFFRINAAGASFTVGEGATLTGVGACRLVSFAANGTATIGSGVTVVLENVSGAVVEGLAKNVGDETEGTFSIAEGAKFVLDGTNWFCSGEDTPWGTVWANYDFEIRSLASLELDGEAFEMREYFSSLGDYAYDPTGSYDAAGLLELMEMYILYYAFHQSGVTTAALAEEASADRGGLVLNLTGLCPITIAGAEITVTGLSGEYAATAFTVLAGSLTVENCNINVESAPFAVVDGGAMTYKNTIIVITGEMALALPGDNIVLDGVTLVVPTDSEIYPTAAHAAIGAYAPIVKFGGVEYKAWSCNKASGENASVVGAVSLYVNTGDAATSGIRFTSTVSADVLSALREGGKTLKFGTLVAPADYVAKAKSFTPAALVAAFGQGVTSYVKIPAVYSVLEDASGVSFSGILVNLKSNTRVYAAVSYIEVYEGETLVETIYSAYDAQFNAQSAEQLADAITETLDADQQAIVDAYANGKVN